MTTQASYRVNTQQPVSAGSSTGTFLSTTIPHLVVLTHGGMLQPFFLSVVAFQPAVFNQLNLFLFPESLAPQVHSASTPPQPASSESTSPAQGPLSTREMFLVNANGLATTLIMPLCSRSSPESLTYMRLYLVFQRCAHSFSTFQFLAASGGLGSLHKTVWAFSCINTSVCF